jgi:hypothetical protein
MQKIADKVLFQMEVEKLMNAEVGKILDINPAYLSIIKKPEQFGKCPMKAWRKMHIWYHSGSPLKGYDPTKAPEVPDVNPGEEESGTIPEIRRSAPPKTEPAPTGQPESPAAPTPIPEFKHTHAGPGMTIDASTRKVVLNAKNPKTKRGPKVKDEGKPGKNDKGKPSQEEIERVLATLDIEITIKLKSKQD